MGVPRGDFANPAAGPPKLVVVAPAFDPAAAGHSAGLSALRGDGADPTAEPANLDRRRAAGSEDLWVVAAFGTRAVVAQLAEVVPAPALDPAAHGQGAGNAASRSDGTHPAAEPGNVDRRSTVRIRPVAQLADVVSAPALDPPAAGHSAGVVVPRGDGADPAVEPANVNRRNTVGIRPVAQLADRVRAPALDPAAAGHSAGVAMEAPRGDGADPAAQRANVNRRNTVRLCPVAQFAVVVSAPALDPAAAGQRAGVLLPRGDGLTPLLSPLTSTGVSLSICVPSPSWPTSFRPQHLTPPLISAQVCASPGGDGRHPAAQAADVDRGKRIVGVRVAELAVLSAPALDSTAGR